MRNVALVVSVLLVGSLFGQTQQQQTVPAAPVPQLPAPLPPQTPTPPAAPGQPLIKLTVRDAEATALKNNPQITVARLSALASHEITRETRSGLLPTATISLTGVDANEGSRIGAGGLNNPVLYDRAAAGTQLSQLITDFGRTTNLLASSKLREKAESQNALATAQQISIAVDQAFYNALQSSALLRVADQTVATRQVVVDRVQALASAKLKSDLDLSFAKVDLSQAKLLQLEAQNNYSASLASLAAILGYPTLQNFQLMDEPGETTAPPPDVNALIQEALQNRPDLSALRYTYESEQKFRNAEHDLSRPTVSALGVVGSVPFETGPLSSWYGAVGVNVNIPVFNGFLFNARAHEADLRAQAADQRHRDLANRISRDVRTAWLDLNRTYQRLDVTQQLLAQANLALDLAQTRYNLGLGTIVEFTQAELQRTQAEIDNTAAQYQYRLAHARLKYEMGEH
ncbi:MAG TPA: TolC family protein [Terriglobales bacterium]|nr:TolC family protein [Terriglobales bacterium]